MALQIVEKSGGGLSRVYGVTVPAQTLNERLEAKIAEIRPRLQLKGFRPGKVPAAHVRRMYGKSLMGEIVQESLQEGEKQALDEANLRPAGQPDLKVESDINKVLAGEADLAFELAVEVMPEFEPVDISTLELKRPVYEPTEDEVQAQLEELAAQNRTYEAKTGKAVKAQDGDMVVADFVGRIDGQPFEGGSAEDAEIVIGSGRFIPGFEDQLKGAKPGSTVTVSVSFPEDYPVDTLKGKAAEFEVTVKEVRAPVEGQIDDAFAERLGLPSLGALKDAIRGQLQQQYAQASRFKLKRALLDALDQRHDFPLPPRMVDNEFQVIWSQLEQERARGELSEEDQGKSDDQLRAEYRKIAERRVRLGLILAEIGGRNGVTVSDQELNQAIRNEAMRYRGQEQQVFDLFRNNPNAQAQLRAPIYEEKVVDLITSRAKVEDVPVSKDELLAEDEMPEGYAEPGEAAPEKKASKRKAAKAEAPQSEAEPVEAEAAQPPKKTASRSKAAKAELQADAASAPLAEAASEPKPAKAAKPRAKKPKAEEA